MRPARPARTPPTGARTPALGAAPVKTAAEEAPAAEVAMTMELPAAAEVAPPAAAVVATAEAEAAPEEPPDDPPPLAATQEQRAWADIWTDRAVSTEQAAMTGEEAADWMAAELEHWQAKSVRPQPYELPKDSRALV